MNLEDYKKYKTELDVEYKNNNDKIRKLERNIKILNDSTFKAHAINSILFSIVPYIFAAVSFMTFPILETASIFVVEIIMVFIPLLFGICAEQILYKKNKTHEKLRKISNARNDAEKLEEKIRYEFEIEKLKNRNRVLKLIDNKVTLKQKAISDSTKGFYDDDLLEEKSKEEVKIAVKLIKENITDFNNILDSISINDVLSNYRDTKYCKINRCVEFTCINSLLMMVICITPLLSVSKIMTQLSILDMITPAIAGLIINASYYMKNNDNYSIALKKFKSKNKNKKINWGLDALISCLANAKLQLKEEQEKLNNFQSIGKIDRPNKNLFFDENTKNMLLDNQQSYVEEQMMMDYFDLCRREKELSDILKQTGPERKKVKKIMIKK